MTTRVHADPGGGAAHESMVAHLSGPFTGGAVETRLILDAAGEARVDWPARLPIVAISLRVPATDAVRVTVTVAQSSGEVVAPVTLQFAGGTEAGASLLAYVPGAASLVLEAVTPFTIRVAPAGGGDPTPLAAAVEARVIEGNLGRLLFVAGCEKARLRRVAAAVCASRTLANAHGEALDRAGADVGVPRLDARLAWDATFHTPTIEPAGEPDEQLRARLGLYRKLMRPTRRAVEELLNGPGTGPNQGLPASFGVVGRFDVQEPNTELVVAIRLVSTPDDAPRAQLIDEIRQTFLVEPGADVPSSRLVPSDVRAAENALRARLAANLDVAPGTHLAPVLARILDRIARCRRALGVTRRWRVLPPVATGKESRHELGLGVDVEPMPAAELDQLAAALASGAIAAEPGDVETPVLLAMMQPRPSAEDGTGRWFLTPCGASTIHPVDGTRIYLSHVVVHGLVVGENVVANRHLLEAHWHAPGDVGGHVALVMGLADADAARAAAGLPPWTLITGAAESAAWALAVPPAAPLAEALTDAVLGVTSTPQAVAGAVEALAQMPNELLATLQLDTTFAAALAANHPDAVDALRRLVAMFQRAGLASVLPLPLADGRILLVVGVTALPGNSAPLTARANASFRWHLVPLVGNGGELVRKIGSRNEWKPGAGPAVAAIVAVAPGRHGSVDPRGRVDPLDLVVSLPAGSLLSLPQYELVMNLLERARPLGVVVDTIGIRNRIDADADGDAEPLSRALSRTFRPYHQRRHVGASSDDPR